MVTQIMSPDLPQENLSLSKKTQTQGFFAKDLAGRQLRTTFRHNPYSENDLRKHGAVARFVCKAWLPFLFGPFEEQERWSIGTPRCVGNL